MNNKYRVYIRTKYFKMSATLREPWASYLHNIFQWIFDRSSEPGSIVGINIVNEKTFDLYKVMENAKEMFKDSKKKTDKL